MENEKNIYFSVESESEYFTGDTSIDIHSPVETSTAKWGPFTILHGYPIYIAGQGGARLPFYKGIPSILLDKGIKYVDFYKCTLFMLSYGYLVMA